MSSCDIHLGYVGAFQYQQTRVLRTFLHAHSSGGARARRCCLRGTTLVVCICFLLLYFIGGHHTYILQFYVHVRIARIHLSTLRLLVLCCTFTFFVIPRISSYSCNRTSFIVAPLALHTLITLHRFFWSILFACY
jgi:hypothetical protein